MNKKSKILPGGKVIDSTKSSLKVIVQNKLTKVNECTIQNILIQTTKMIIPIQVNNRILKYYFFVKTAKLEYCKYLHIGQISKT